MKKILFLLLFTLFVGVKQSTAQSFCATPAITNLDKQQKGVFIQRSNSNAFYYLKVFFHVVRKSNGSGGVSNSNVQMAINTLNNDFCNCRIMFVWDGNID